MNEIQVFNYGEVPVRTTIKDGEPWWVLKDVCQILGINNHRDLPKRLDTDEVGRFELPHPQNPTKLIEMVCVNESGLYNVILRSDKPKAKEFKRWVTHEVLPAIHKTGSYSVSPYKPKVSSVGEVIKLVEMTRSMMEEQGCSPNDIAQAVKQLCDQFNINLPDFFVKPKDLTLEDAMDMIDFVYAHERGRGKRKPTYEEFIEVQIAVKRLEY